MKSNNYLFAETSDNFSSNPQLCRFYQTLQKRRRCVYINQQFSSRGFPPFRRFF